MRTIGPIRVATGICMTGFALLVAITLHSCKASQAVAAKSGAQLWAENCQRCHNTPSPSTFSPEQWQTIGMHMQTRSLITEDEKKKIIAFLQQ
jgi:cytochrome c2